jgi:manganese transport protein
VKRFLGVTLGILTAIGGFVDIGDLVASSLVGARFGMGLVWALLAGVVVICLFAEMAGRVAAVAGRPVFDLVRERLGPKAALANLAASFFVTLLTLTAEIGGVALALELATSVNYLLWVPMVGFLVWLVVWRVKFDTMEQGFGLAGLALVAAAPACSGTPATRCGGRGRCTRSCTGSTTRSGSWTGTRWPSTGTA